MTDTEKNISDNTEPLGTNKLIIPDILRPQKSSLSFADQTSNLQIQSGKSIIFDWGRKRTGWILLNASGSAKVELAGDIRIFEMYDSSIANNPDFCGDKHPSFCANKSRCEVDFNGKEAYLSKMSSAFRYIRITNLRDTDLIIKSIMLKPSEFPARPRGSFECDSETINSGWQMGIDTVHLCTQPGDQSFTPIFAPFGDGYVQWDGCRRDREIWGGDLRPSALAWFYNFEDQSPIANSIYAIMNSQHCGCSEHGLFPGSGSTHQTFYEWAFWEVSCLWEYILHTGDKKLLKFAAHKLPLFLEWCEKKTAEHPDGWILSKNCWMYTLEFPEQVLPSLQAASLMGFESMKKIFDFLQMEDFSDRTQLLIKRVRKNFHKTFWDKKLNAYKFLTIGDSHSDLCANAWAILSDIVKKEERESLLKSIKDLHWTNSGSLNISPVMQQESFHNNTIWPYANSYEMCARFHCGDSDSALELFKAYIGNIRKSGHNTLLEMINIDSSLPIKESDGNTLSFSHCWASQGSWALQKYLLGVAPVKIGWQEFSFSPLKSPLKWLNGKIVTPYGTIDVEIDNSKQLPKAKVVHPREIECSNSSDYRSVEFVSK
ncbi:MAG: hypothetical protein ACIAQZ_11285 [Sedimentisphaeraceae bacterium JB056]